MGVKGLWQLISPTGKPISLDSLDGKVLAVDVSIWLNKAAKGMRDGNGYQVYNAHLVLMFHRICKLLFYGVKPVIVFDGGVPELKKETLRLRRDRRKSAEEGIQKAKEGIIKKYLQRKALETMTGTESGVKLKIGGKNKEPDLFELPESSSSQTESSDDESLVDEWTLRTQMSQAIHETPENLDFNSEAFAFLPAEVQYELLLIMQDGHRKKRKRKFKDGSGTTKDGLNNTILPQESSSFSELQLENLKTRGMITHRLDRLKKDMNDSMTTDFLDQINYKKFEPRNHSLELKKVRSDSKKGLFYIKQAKSKDENILFCSDLDNVYARFKQRENIEKGTFHKLERVPAKFESINTNDPSIKESVNQALNESDDDDSSVRIKTPKHSSFSVDILSDNSTSDEEVDWVDIKDSDVVDSQKLSRLKSFILLSDDETDSTLLTNLAENKNASSSTQNTNLTSIINDNTTIIKVHNELKNLPQLIDKVPCQSDIIVIHDDNISNVDKQGKDKSKNLLDIEVKDKINTSFSKDEALEKTSKAGEMEETYHQVIEDHKLLSVDVSDIDKSKLIADTSESISERPTTANELASKQDSSLNQDQLIISDSQSELLVKSTTSKSSNDGENHMETELLPDSEFSIGDELVENIDFVAESVEPNHNDTFKSLVADKKKENLQVIQEKLIKEQIELESKNIKDKRQAATLTKDMYSDVQELLQLFGIPYIISPMEAEAQCAQLEIMKLTDGSITDDGDVFLFGGQTVYKNIFNQKNYAERYEAKHLSSLLNLNREKLIALAFLTGSDYTVGLHGIGYVTAMEILHSFNDLDPSKTLSKFKNWLKKLNAGEEVFTPISKLKSKLKDIVIPRNFNDGDVWEAYLRPKVDESDEHFLWGSPMEERLKDFAKEKLGWITAHINDVLDPVLKRLDEQKKAQKTIDRYFLPQVKIPETTIKSKRLLKLLENRNDRSLNDEEFAILTSEIQSGESLSRDQESAVKNDTSLNVQSFHTQLDHSNGWIKKSHNKTPTKNKFDLNLTTISSLPNVQAKKKKNLMNAAVEAFKPLPPFIRMSMMNKSVRNRLKGKKVRTKTNRRQKEATVLMSQAQAIADPDAPKPLISSESDSD